MTFKQQKNASHFESKPRVNVKRGRGLPRCASISDKIAPELTSKTLTGEGFLCNDKPVSENVIMVSNGVVLEGFVC